MAVEIVITVVAGVIIMAIVGGVTYYFARKLSRRRMKAFLKKTLKHKDKDAKPRVQLMDGV